MARTLFFRMAFRKFSEITKNKPIFSQHNIFYNYEYFFFQFAFWSLFSHRQRSQSNQEQCSLRCRSTCFCVLLCTHYGPLQCSSTYFRKIKEIGVLRPMAMFIYTRMSMPSNDILAQAASWVGENLFNGTENTFTKGITIWNNKKKSCQVW